MRSPGVPRALFVVLCLAAVSAAGCASGRYLTATGPAPVFDLPAESVTRHVVLVSIDGLRPDAISAFEAPQLQRLIREGSFTLGASTILPSKTLPSHTSMLTGEPPERHGVWWNDVVSAKTDRVEQATIFSVARAHGYVTAAFFSKPKFKPLQRDDTMDYSQVPGGLWGGWDAEKTVEDVEEYLETARPNLLFVHLAEPDRAGHGFGWMSKPYGLAVRESDVAIGRILAAADGAFGAGNYTVIVTADHGGHGRDHGSDDPRDVTIPWIAWGQGVPVRQLQPGTVRTMDTASTVLWLLGLDEPGDWEGAPVTAAFGGE